MKNGKKLLVIMIAVVTMLSLGSFASASQIGWSIMDIDYIAEKAHTGMMQVDILGGGGMTAPSESNYNPALNFDQSSGKMVVDIRTEGGGDPWKLSGFSATADLSLHPYLYLEVEKAEMAYQIAIKHADDFWVDETTIIDATKEVGVHKLNLYELVPEIRAEGPSSFYIKVVFFGDANEDPDHYWLPAENVISKFMMVSEDYTGADPTPTPEESGNEEPASSEAPITDDGNTTPGDAGVAAMAIMTLGSVSGLLIFKKRK